MNNMRWEPLEDGEYSWPNWDGKGELNLVINAGGSQLEQQFRNGNVVDPNPDYILLNTDIRLCRQVPAEPPLDMPDGPGWWAYDGEKKGVVWFTQFAIDEADDSVTLQWGDDDYTMKYTLSWFRNFYVGMKFYRLPMTRLRIRGSRIV